MVAQNPSPLTPEQQQRVTDNMGLVHRLAMQYVEFPGHDRDEAVQNGTLGLIHAVIHFKSGLGLRFSTYAYRCIWGQIRTPCLPGSHARPLPRAELYPGIGKDERREIHIESVEDVDRREDVATLLWMLTPVEERVITLRFGLDGAGKRILDAIADEIGLSKERVRQIQNKAIKKMREAEPATS